MSSMNWKILTDFAPTTPQHPGSFPSTTANFASTPTTSTTASSSSSDGGGWIALLFFAVPVGIGYVLVQAFVPEANEPLGWITFGFGAIGALAVSALLLLLVACGAVAAARFTSRAFGRALFRLRAWMGGRSRRRASAAE